MTATNHALTGAFIGLVVSEPVLALPLAFASHFVMDAIPHFGAGKEDGKWVKSAKFAKLLIAETSVCFLIVLALVVMRPRHWLIAAICAFLAASPDFISIRKFVILKQNKKFRPNKLEALLKKIQWFEHPSGAVVEIVWLAAMLVCLGILIR